MWAPPGGKGVANADGSITVIPPEWWRYVGYTAEGEAVFASFCYNYMQVLRSPKCIVQTLLCRYDVQECGVVFRMDVPVAPETQWSIM
jgi:hypothetical protein